MSQLPGITVTAALWFVSIVASGASAQATAGPCSIEVVEKGSGWPVPLVILRTTSELRFVTDNAGLVSINEPDLMHREVFFHVEGDGYEVPPDGFGYRGVRLALEPGKEFRVEVNRSIIARRVGRLTGAGLFAESAKAGRRIGGTESDTETGVVGCDSVQLAQYGGKYYWFWGDTGLPHYPLGIFHATGATTERRPFPQLEPPLRVKYEYFADDAGKPRGVAPMPGDGPTWLTGLVVLPDQSGTQRLVATYAKIKPPLDVYRWGLCVWNDATERFEQQKTIWERSESADKPMSILEGHPVLWRDEGGREWVLFGNPLPRMRCPATFEAWQDPSQWQAVDSPKTLAAAGSARPVRPHSGSIAWHAWRQRWVALFVESFGEPSVFGEVWYAEADAPTGPWGPAVKVLSHRNYTYYNPRIHADLISADSPALLFEGTYTVQFANHPRPTPRYDYNQILYRLDLDDPRLKSPMAP